MGPKGPFRDCRWSLQYQGGHIDIIMSPKGSIGHPYQALEDYMGLNNFPFSYILFVFILMSSIITFREAHSPPFVINLFRTVFIG